MGVSSSIPLELASEAASLPKKSSQSKFSESAESLSAEEEENEGFGLGLEGREGFGLGLEGREGVGFEFNFGLGLEGRGGGGSLRSPAPEIRFRLCVCVSSICVSPTGVSSSEIASSGCAFLEDVEGRRAKRSSESDQSQSSSALEGAGLGGVSLRGGSSIVGTDLDSDLFGATFWGVGVTLTVCQSSSLSLMASTRTTGVETGEMSR